MSLVIRAAARTLPAAIRDRYREQWLADVRDAPEAGLRPASIALAALAFAVTYDRPFPARRVPTDEQRAQRSRLAVGLGLSAALLSLSAFPLLRFGGLAGNGLWDYAAFVVSALLLAFAVLAPVTALVLVRGRRARIAVVLFAVASTAPVVQGLVDGVEAYRGFHGAVFVAAVLFVVTSCALVWRPTVHRSFAAPLIGGVAVLGVNLLGLVYGAGFAWPNRTTLNFGAENPAYYEEWLQLKLQYEALVNQVFWVWALAAAVLGVLVFVIGRRMNTQRATALAIATSAISLLVASGVFGLLELGMRDTVAPVLLDPLRLLAQVVLVAVTLVAVGGIRYLSRMRHRHDVEGAV